MEWYVFKLETSVQLGPIRRSELLRLRDDGSLTPQDLVYCDEVLPDWTTAGKIRQLFHNGGVKWKYPLPHLRDPERPTLYIVEDSGYRGPYCVNELRLLIEQQQLFIDSPIFDQDGQKTLTFQELIGANLIDGLNETQDATVEIETARLQQETEESSAPPELFHVDDQELLLVPIEVRSEDNPARVELFEQEKQDTSLQAASVPDDEVAPGAHVINQILDDESSDELPVQQPRVTEAPKKRKQSASPPGVEQQPRKPAAQSQTRKQTSQHNKKTPGQVQSAFETTLKELAAGTPAAAPVLPRIAGKKSLPAKLPKLPKPSKVKPRKVQELSERDETDATGSRTLRKLIRSVVFARAFMIWTMISAGQGFVFLAISSSFFSMFMRRVGTVCLNTFIPFEATPEELHGEGLLAAGISVAMLGVGVAYPLWYVLRTDCLPWLSVAAGILGILMGFGVQPEHLPNLVIVMKFAVILAGFCTSMTGFWLLGSSRKQELFQQLLLPAIAAGLGLTAMVFVDHRNLLVADISELPPKLHGDPLSAVLFILGTWLVTCAYPAFCIRVMYQDVDRPSQEFMSTHLFGSLVCGGIGLVMTFCLASPQPDSFMAVPLALVSFSAINTVVALVPPVMWMITPDSVGLYRSY